ncbi:MAG: hypothetical protein ACRCYY_07695 [Trueperaceae bacterium]
MIQPSQRRRPEKVIPTRTTLDLHDQLAKQRLWFFRLMISSLAALTVSFVLWLVRVPLVWHLGGIAFAFVAGAFVAGFLVERSMKAWSLAWIRERSGLSYETALEKAQQERVQREKAQQDSFGFATTVQKRALESAAQLTPPTYQAWWLPPLVVALGFAFLPLIPKLNALPTTLTARPPTTNTNTPNAPATPEQPNPQRPNQPEANTSSTSPATSPREADTSGLEGSSNTGSGNPNNQTADEEALGEFLDNLKQQQPPSTDVDTDLSSVMPQSQRATSGNQDSSSQPRSEQPRSEQPRSEPTNPFSQASQSEGERAQQEQAQQEQTQQGEGEETQSQTEQQAQQSEGGQNEGAGANEQPENQSGTSEQQQSTSQQNTEANQEGSEPPTEGNEGEEGQQGGGGQSANAEGEGRSESDSGQNADGAGNLPGTPVAQDSDDIGTSQQSPEFLEGQVTESASNTAGTVRLPGESEGTAFPETNAPSTFSRAEEEALTEGRIPLEYQEVIRNYFRGE